MYRYNIEAKVQSKIKNWQYCLPEALRGQELDLELYDSPMTLVRAVLDQDYENAPSPQPGHPGGRKRKKEQISYAEDEEEDEEEGGPEMKKGRGSISSIDLPSQRVGFGYFNVYRILDMALLDLIFLLFQNLPKI
jgi:hypothetical protein